MAHLTGPSVAVAVAAGAVVPVSWMLGLSMQALHAFKGTLLLLLLLQQWYACCRAETCAGQARAAPA